MWTLLNCFSDALSFSMYFRDFACVLLVLRAKQCNFEVSLFSLKMFIQYNFFKEGLWEIFVGSSSELHLVFTITLSVENTEKFRSISGACLLEVSGAPLTWSSLNFTCFASDPHGVASMIFASPEQRRSCSPKCELINKAVWKAEVEKKVDAWKNGR